MVGVAACSAQRLAPPEASDPYPTTLVPLNRVQGQFIRRQRLIALYGGVTRSFDAVLQKRRDSLLILGLTPFGTKAFALSQVGLSVHFTQFLPFEVRFPPRYILYDISRTYFESIGNGVLPDGIHRLERNGERITERWKDGRLYERRFRRIDRFPSGAIVISYAGGMAGNQSPPKIDLDNGWLGYKLTILTLSEAAL